MQTENRFLDDLAKLISNAAGAAQGMKGELDGLFRQRVERLLDGFDFVARDEFEAVKAMAAAAREENDRLEARIAALEAQAVTRAKRPRSAKTSSA